LKVAIPRQIFTLDDGQQNNNNEEEEGDIEHNTIHFIFVAVGRFNFITDTTTSSDTLE
jgi:hypothetical protein